MIENRHSLRADVGRKMLLYILPALIQAVFHVGDRFWARENRRPKNKIFFPQDKFYSLKAHEHYFTVLIYLAT